jgi:hypothetical protein
MRPDHPGVDEFDVMVKDILTGFSSKLDSFSFGTGKVPGKWMLATASWRFIDEMIETWMFFDVEHHLSFWNNDDCSKALNRRAWISLMEMGVLTVPVDRHDPIMKNLLKNAIEIRVKTCEIECTCTGDAGCTGKHEPRGYKKIAVEHYFESINSVAIVEMYPRSKVEGTTCVVLYPSDLPVKGLKENFGVFHGLGTLFTAVS